jgi:hypothetical protein
VIEEAVTAIQAAANQVPVTPEELAAKLPPTRKRGPDLNRPW